LREAWREQIRYNSMCTERKITMAGRPDQRFCSLLVRWERGNHLNQGGAIYDMTSGAWWVPSGQCLAALKKLCLKIKCSLRRK
jgi:hypothetical protein